MCVRERERQLKDVTSVFFGVCVCVIDRGRKERQKDREEHKVRKRMKERINLKVCVFV